MAVDFPSTPLSDVTRACPSAVPLVVRPIIATEREAWDTLMDRHHYLGFRVIVGESLRYVALLDDRLVALLKVGRCRLQEPSSGQMDCLGGAPEVAAALFHRQ